MSDDHKPAEFAPFFEGLQQGHLSFPRCDTCGRFHWYPMKFCPHCQHAISWVPVSGPGRLHSWTVIRHPFDAGFADRLPYIVGLVEFEDAPGVRLITTLVGLEPEQVEMDMAVEPVFGAGDPPQAPVVFKPRPAP